MDTNELFTVALDLPEPWFVADVNLAEDEESGVPELHIVVTFPKGSKFPCPVDGCKELLTAYDIHENTWRHLNFFQYRTYIHAEVPRVRCGEHGVKTIAVPWARPGSGFTLMAELRMLELSKEVSVRKIGEMLGEHDTRIWRVLKYYVEKAREKADYSNVTAIGIDETSKKGQRYITVMVDENNKRVIYVTDGKDSPTVTHFREDFEKHQGKPEKISIITCDMSPAFKKGAEENFPNSSRVIDKFHVIKHANEAVDTVRKAEVKYNQDLKKTKYIWLKNDENLTDAQRVKKESLMKKHLKTARAYTMRVELQDIYENCQSRSEAEDRLKKLCVWMMHSRLEPMKELCKTIRNHWNEILNYFSLRHTNAILEGMNSIIQNVKRRARGFRNPEYFKTMIYLCCGKLDLDSVAESFA